MITIIGVTSLKEYRDEQRHNQQMAEIYRLEMIIGKRIYLDSIYALHIKDCSMLRREDIVVGYDGYLRTTYVNGHGPLSNTD